MGGREKDGRMRVMIRSWTIQDFLYGAAFSALTLYVMNGPQPSVKKGQSSRRERCCTTPQYHNDTRDDFVLSSTE